MDNHAKVSYTTIEGVESTAYVVFTDNLDDYGIGTDKHTDKPVTVQWVDVAENEGFWKEVDTGVEYEFDVVSGVWSEVAGG